MPLRDPLPIGKLSEIQAKYPRNSDVIALLWEIRRLQNIAVRAHQLVESLPKVLPDAQRLIRDSLEAELEGEPAVIAHKEWKADMLKEPT